MSASNDMINDLYAHLNLCREVLQLAEAEADTLRQSPQPILEAIYKSKKALLPRLNQSLDTIRKHRVSWQQMSVAERDRYPEIASLLRQNQDLIMKIIVLDRENEQGLLRRGLVPPQEMSGFRTQRPRFVGDLYRQAASRS